MGKDKKARDEGKLTVLAIANLTAAIVDAMQDAELPPSAVIRFIDRFDELNAMTLWGRPGTIMGEIVQVLRRSIATND